MILDTTTRKLQVVLGEAHTTNALAVVASWFDSGLTPSGGPQLSNTNGTSAVDIVLAPASGYIRQVNELTVFNADTITHNVTLRYNDNGTTYTIQKQVLPAGYALNYSKALGWSVLSATGEFTTSVPAVNLYWRTHLSANQNFTVSTNPVIAMDIKDFDPNGWCDIVTNKGRVTPKVPGKYLVTVAAAAAGTTGPAVGSELCRSAIGLNGAQVALHVVNAQVASLASNAQFSNCTSIIAVNGSTDYIEPIGGADTSAPHIVADTRFTYMTGTYIGP